jgi:hypothetical protein
MKCDNCPEAWVDRSYEGECNACGCLILGNDMFDDNCRLSAEEIDKRLTQLKTYEDGKIDRMIRRMRNNYESKTYEITDRNAVEWRKIEKWPPEVRNRSQG